MGFTEPCFADSDETIAAQAFPKRGITADFDWDRLKQTAGCVSACRQPYAPFAEGGFPTPSGKCEFYSEQLAKLGLDPLPAYVPPYEGADQQRRTRAPLSAGDDFAAGAQFPQLVRSSTCRACATIEGEPTLEMHPDDAAARGIADGSRVRVFNDRGSMELAVA